MSSKKSVEGKINGFMAFEFDQPDDMPDDEFTQHVKDVSEEAINVIKRGGGFLISTRELNRALEEAQKDGNEVVGAYGIREDDWEDLL